MHPSYYYRAHACVLVFDVTRKTTYKNLTDWYGDLRQYCEGIPCLLVANKIDVDYNVRAIFSANIFPRLNILTNFSLCGLLALLTQEEEQYHF